MIATTIYALKDPRAVDAKYVGKTDYSVPYRVGRHIHRAKNGGTAHMNVWIRSLLAKGLRPDPVVLEKIYRSSTE